VTRWPEEDGIPECVFAFGAVSALVIVRGGHLVRGVSPDGAPEIVRQGGMLVRDGAIAAIGQASDLIRDHPELPVVGTDRDVVLPGLVNAHHHTGLSPLQRGVLPAPLELWLPQFLGLRRIDARLDTLSSAIEMIESGVTTVQHIHGGPSGPRSDWSREPERIMDAYREIGMRASFCSMLRDRNRVVLGDDDAFLARLPASTAARMRAVVEAEPAETLPQLDFFEELAARWNRADSPLTRVQLAPANLHWCSDASLVQQRDVAARHGVSLHMHLLETPYQRVFAERQTGSTAVAHLADLGLLGPKLTLGHAIWLEDRDLDLIAQSGTKVCHNASSGLKLGSGVTPAAELAARGVTVALGIDQSGINDDHDMLQEMRLAWALARRPARWELAPDAAAVFRMATEGGAATTDFADTIGRLDPGRAADAILMDRAGFATPSWDADVPLLDALLHRAKAGDVHTSMVAGRLIMQNRTVLFVDKAALTAEIAERLSAPADDAEVGARTLARDVLPYVEAFYATWHEAARAGAACCTYQHR
jgi:cytosine/adenosine deaminase-related metal-dependent hydrolase